MIPPEPKASAARLVADRVDQLRPGHVVMQALTRNVREKAAAVEDACLASLESVPFARECFEDMEPLLATARAARTRRATPTTPVP
ncbi:MAG: hypothetical protein CVU65_06345 [Deltaproteobacteria bacterium HGW-Deltaproteobacteria-22]|jgi:hypothetical protein|nr:MAG: hypothetical protein CVU65_06345 [Deltaproteobacteria bacterium HGW-Deltaproteobacteria-22]